MTITKEFSNRLAISMIILFVYMGTIGFIDRQYLQEYRLEKGISALLVVGNFFVAFIQEVIKANRR
jgi:hypothetical protein